MAHHTLDARNLLCPMPVIKVQNAILQFKPGDTLTVYCTDPGTLYDIPAWCRVHKRTILETTQHERDIVITIGV